MDSIYREHIMDHYKNPRHHGTLPEATVHHKGFNPLCGDEVEVFIKIEDNKVTDIKFSGKGCAISQAATSMLTEKIVGKTADEIQKITKEEIFEMVGITLSPSRIKCALLGWDTVREGLHG